MSTNVYAWGDNRTPVGILQGRYLYETSGRQIVACADSEGRLYNSPNAGGGADYVLVGDQVREHSENGSTVFTIRGDGICDGCGSSPTFHCVTNSSDNRLALALTAIANVGDLRFRPNDADVVSSSRYIGWSSRNKPDSNLDYSKLFGSSPDPFANRTTPTGLGNLFNDSKHSSNSFDNIQGNRVPPSYKHGNEDGQNVQSNENSDGGNFQTNEEPETLSRQDKDRLYELLAGPKIDDGTIYESPYPPETSKEYEDWHGITRSKKIENIKSWALVIFAVIFCLFIFHSC